MTAEETELILTQKEIEQSAIGYVAGREHASGVKTCAPNDELPGHLAFTEAYLQALVDFCEKRRSAMPSMQEAYDTWQRTGGETPG